MDDRGGRRLGHMVNAEGELGFAMITTEMIQLLILVGVEFTIIIIIIISHSVNVWRQYR